jgi:transcription antitermination factor NusG
MAKFWYVLRSKPNKEVFLAEQLWLRGIETFSPKIRVQVVNPRARKIRSYFPGYIFIHTDLEKNNLSTFQFIPGASGLVMFGGEIPSVPDGLVHAIQSRVEEINTAGGELLETLKPGAALVIHSGPFTGYEAIFDERLPGTERVRVLLKLLKNRQLQVDLPAGQVRLKKASPR